jgi:hypothetical protein
VLTGSSDRQHKDDDFMRLRLQSLGRSRRARGPVGNPSSDTAARGRPGRDSGDKIILLYYAIIYYYCTYYVGSCMSVVG